MTKPSRTPLFLSPWLTALFLTVLLAPAEATDPYWEPIQQHGDVPTVTWEATASFGRVAGNPGSPG